MKLALPGFLKRADRPDHASQDVKTYTFPVSPSWFYSITTPDGTERWALSAASGATIYAQAPADTVVVPKTPLVIHQAAGAYLWKAREAGGVAGVDLEELTVEVPSLAAPLVIAEVRMRGAFHYGWAERLNLSGLRIVSVEGLTRVTEQLPMLLRSRGVRGSVQSEPRGGMVSRCHDARRVVTAV
jgi:hypothetical protein